MSALDELTNPQNWWNNDLTYSGEPVYQEAVIELSRLRKIEEAATFIVQNKQNFFIPEPVARAAFDALIKAVETTDM